MISRATNPTNPARFRFRCLVAVSVPRIHDLRAEELSGSEALRASMVHRQSARTPSSGSRTQDHDGLLPAALPGAVPRRARLPVPVSVFSPRCFPLTWMRLARAGESFSAGKSCCPARIGSKGRGRSLRNVRRRPASSSLREAERSDAFSSYWILGLGNSEWRTVTPRSRTPSSAPRTRAYIRVDVRRKLWRIRKGKLERANLASS